MPTAPVAITNRVVPGFVVKSSGAFGFLTRFEVPADLQEQLGLSIALTDFNVKISGKPRTLKVGKVKKSISYLQLTSCKGSLPVKAIAQFKDTLARNPTHPQALFNIGVALVHGKNDPQDAVQYWEKLVDTNPNYPELNIVKEQIRIIKEQLSQK